MTTRNDLFPLAVRLAAQASERTTGVPTCVTLAQWAQESGYGRYSMGTANNPFGIKWTQATPFNYVVRRTWEVIRGKRIDVDARFVSFPSLAAAFQYHGKMLTNPKGWYVKSLPLRYDWRAYVKAIAPIYATDPNYATALIAIIERWKLYEINLPPNFAASISRP